MPKVRNNSNTLFRWQEYIWRPGEVIDLGEWEWEKRLALELTSQHACLEIVSEEDEKKQAMADRMAKARAARGKK